MIRFLLDQGLPRSSASLLRQAGIDTMHVAEIGMSRATDAEILQQARAEDRVVVTLDADFHALLALSGESEPSVIRIRIEGLRAESVAILVQTIIARCSDDILAGSVVTVQRGRLRVRRLPIVPSRY